MGILSVSHDPVRSFGEAQRLAETGYHDPALGTELTNWADDPKPSLHNLPDIFAAFYAALAIARLRNLGQSFRVLDFGGQEGAYFDYVTEAFGDTLKIEWLVVETAICVNHGRKWGNPAVTFAETLDEVGEVDFAMFGGVLQYLDDWQAPLRHSVVREAGHVFVTRTPLAAQEQAFLQTVTYTDKVNRRAARVLRTSDLSGELQPTHSLFASWAIEQYLGTMGAARAPAMLWRRKAPI